MSINGPIKIWRKTPEELANYKPGQDLGEPDEIVEPETLIRKGDRNPMPSFRRRKAKK
jgi:hypothetical protein